MAGHNNTLGGGGFHHVAIKVQDFDRSFRLYTEAFGFKLKTQWGEKTAEADTRAAMLDVGDGNYLEMFAGGSKQVRAVVSPTASGGPIIHIAFRTTCLDTIAAKAKALGLPVTVEPKEVTIPGAPLPVPCKLFFCQGYDGELVEFFQNQAT